MPVWEYALETFIWRHLKKDDIVHFITSQPWFQLSDLMYRVQTGNNCVMWISYEIYIYKKRDYLPLSKSQWPFTTSQHSRILQCKTEV